MSEQNRKGRLQLVLLMTVFFGPLILAWLVYSLDIDLSAGHSTAHGILITPVKLVDDASLSIPREEQGSPYPGRWTLALALDGACDNLCEKLLYETRQVRVALGKEDRRVQRLVFLTGHTPLNATVLAKHPGVRVFSPDSALAGQFFAAIEPYGTDNVFLIDPLGNLIMRFTADTSMKDMHKDLHKLLTISQIG